MNIFEFANVIQKTYGIPMKPVIPLEPLPKPPAATEAPAIIKKRTKMSRFYDESNDRYVEALPVQSDEAQKRQHLMGRLEFVSSQKYTHLEKMYGLRNDDPPRSFVELQKRLKDGLFIIDDKKKDRESYDPLNYVEWRDPSIERDDVAFKAACEQKDKQYTTAVDQIAVADPIDGLKALQTFEAWMPKKK